MQTILREAADIIDAAQNMRDALVPAEGSARAMEVCQECGFGQYGEYAAIDAFDKAIAVTDSASN